MDRLKRRFVIGSVLLVLFFVPLLGGSVFIFKTIVSDHNRLVSTYTRQLLLTKDLTNTKTQQASFIPLFNLTKDPTILSRIEVANDEFALILNQLNQITTAPAAKEMLQTIEQAQKANIAADLKGIALINNGASQQAVNDYFGTEGKPPRDATWNALQKYATYTTYTYHAEIYNGQQFSHMMILLFTVVSALAVILCLAVGAYMLQLVRNKQRFDRTRDLLIEKELQLSTARKEAVEIVAHDLKSPLSSIVMGSELITSKWLDGMSPQAQKMLSVMVTSAQSMQKLIDDLLDHAKIEAGRMAVTTAPCDMRELLQQLAARFEPIAAEKTVRLENDIQGDIPVCHVDAGRIEQVLSNLIGNAIKFTPAQGTVRLTTASKGGRLSIAVTDTGAGMDQTQLDHIFERYWQVRETASKGTGLGLAISKAIAQAHGGDISVESSVGQGSTFALTLLIK